MLFQAAVLPFILGAVYSSTTVRASPRTAQKPTEITPLVQAQSADEDEDPRSLRRYLYLTLSSWRYYHTALMIFLKVGIGATFTTNIGPAVAASLSKDASEAAVNSKVAQIVIM